jgi:hypothetical protein
LVDTLVPSENDTFNCVGQLLETGTDQRLRGSFNFYEEPSGSILQKYLVLVMILVLKMRSVSDFRV